MNIMHFNTFLWGGQRFVSFCRLSESPAHPTFLTVSTSCSSSRTVLSELTEWCEGVSSVVGAHGARSWRGVKGYGVL